MVTASVVQTAIFLVTAVKMFTVFQVIQYHMAVVCVIQYISMKSHFTDPRTCEDVGITECCSESDLSGFGSCDVHYQVSQNESVRCSCSVSCHQRNDCCPDAVAIGCLRKSSRSVSYTHLTLPTILRV